MINRRKKPFQGMATFISEALNIIRYPEHTYVKVSMLPVTKQHKVELARILCASDRPINKSQVARVLGIARSSL